MVSRFSFHFAFIFHLLTVDAGHKHIHKRGDIATQYKTVVSPAVIVWVYENGETARVESRTGSPQPTPKPEKLENQIEAESTTTTEASSELPSPSPVQAYEEPSPSPSPESAPSPEPQAPSPPSGPSGLGICYSPYNGDGTCKSQDQVNSDFEKLGGYSIVRIYGVDCNQVSTVTSAASAKGISVFAGLLTIGNVASDLGSLIKQTNGNFGPITTISIGNELVDMGKASVGDVINAIGVARETLGAAGFKGSIVTVDTFNALIANPDLCKKSDYCAANAHSYFDGTIEPSGAGAWVKKQVSRISDAAGRKRVVITESGWPHGGSNNGVAVASPENQKTAIQSIRDSFGSDLFLFTAFDDKWKADGGWGVEKNFGIM